MKVLHTFLVLFVLGVFFGCLSQIQPSTNQSQANATPSCRTVITQVPYTESVCQNVSKMEQVCANKELNYSLSGINMTFICVEQTLCVNYLQNGSCAPLSLYCSKGMTRCRATLINLDDQKAGIWSVGANFTLDGSVFGKNPESVTLLPNVSYVFDFEQFYEMDINQKKASCSIFVSSPAILQDCNYITTMTESCQNQTKYKETEKQVCD